MADTIKKGEFVELDYTGKTKEEGVVFDTTVKKIADEAELGVQKDFKPLIVSAGEGHVLPGLDKQLVGATLGKHTFSVPTEEGFGKKSAKLLQLIPRKKFKEQNIQPVPGLEINVDDQVGVIRSVSGGRIIVDFNHPLASKDLVYEVDIKQKITDQATKVKALLAVMRIPFEDVTITEGKAVVTGTKQLPEEFIQLFSKDVVRLTGVQDLTFRKEEEKENKKV
ncbi:peptidylprolyl isomerase [Candidatus Woesearchaeota archaeon]|nr:peptidylprolyl isomerase [Candidatus Woesearchaeota archaeon]